MAPGLRSGDLVLVDLHAFHYREPRHDELVAIRPAASGGRALVKRLIGLPREQVELEGRRWQLGEDEFFLVGDHLDHSTDCRMFGPVAREALLGPVRARLWPPARRASP